VRVACVLRSGGDYTPEHVAHLAEGIKTYLPNSDIVCLSDVPVPVTRIHLRHDWPGWWSKMELFAPWIDGDILFLDLDTIITGDLADIAAVKKLTLLRDFYRPNGLGSGLMYLPQAERRSLWNHWIIRPSRYMAEAGRGGDQAYLEKHWMKRADRWQDVLPGQIVSYKVHVRQDHHHSRETGTGLVPDGARIVCFHGKPRPWHTDLWSKNVRQTA